LGLESPKENCSPSPCTKQTLSKMEQAPLERAKRQRFVSILCRYPDCTLEEDEDELVVEQFKQRRIPLVVNSDLISVEWEKQALKRKGGYEHIKNNLLRPKDYGPDDLKAEKQVASSITQDDSESYKNITF
jgi:hypothetical protein